MIAPPGVEVQGARPLRTTRERCTTRAHLVQCVFRQVRHCVTNGRVKKDAKLKCWNWGRRNPNFGCQGGRQIETIH